MVEGAREKRECSFWFETSAARSSRAQANLADLQSKHSLTLFQPSRRAHWERCNKNSESYIRLHYSIAAFGAAAISSRSHDRPSSRAFTRPMIHSSILVQICAIRCWQVSLFDAWVLRTNSLRSQATRLRKRCRPKRQRRLELGRVVAGRKRVVRMCYRVAVVYKER